MHRIAPRPGWYYDSTGVERWWDGYRWTERTRQHGGVLGWIVVGVIVLWIAAVAFYRLVVV